MSASNWLTVVCQRQAHESCDMMFWKVDPMTLWQRKGVAKTERFRSNADTCHYSVQVCDSLVQIALLALARSRSGHIHTHDISCGTAPYSLLALSSP
eukprot:5413332-Amphidinium_carterae.1